MKLSKRLVSAVILAGSAVLGVSSAQSMPFFSVDSASNDLVRIDSATGAVTVVGALGMNARNVDLARTADGRLWGLNSDFSNRVDLFEISTTTGAVLSSVQVTLNGNGIVSGEGLTHSGNQLKLSYSPTGNTFATELGDLGFGGAITNSVTIGIDMDGLGAGNGATPFYAVDRDPAAGDTLVYGFDPTALPATLVATLDANTERDNDLVLHGSEIYLVDGFNNALHMFDLGTPGNLNTIALNRGGDYSGLAFAGPISSVPAPGIVSIFALSAAVLGWRRRRR